MSDSSWTIPIMRTGYAGRGITYLAVAGLSLFAIWRGGDAKGTSSTMEALSGSIWGVLTLWLIALGLAAYMIWRLVDAWDDLGDYGTDAKGIVSRIGMATTGLVHGALAGLAAFAALGIEGSGGGIPGFVSAVLGWPGGWLIVGLGGLLTFGAGVYEIRKGIKASHRKHLAANPFTENWDWAIRTGVIAQGVLIVIIGAFLVFAAWTGQAEESGGVERAFDFLENQSFGNFLVIAICIALIGFAFYCFVNAAYRVIPKASDPDLKTVAAKLRAMG